MLSGNKPLPEPMLRKFCSAIGVTRSQIFWEFSIISQWWRVIGTYSAWCKTEASLSYTINCMVADDLAMQGTRTSAASNGIVLLCLEYSYFSTCYINMANTLTRRQDGCHFPDDMFKCIFLTENVWISIESSLKFLCMGPINNIATLVQIMAWHCPGDKPFPESVVVSLLTHVCVTWPQWVKWLPTCHDVFVICLDTFMTCLESPLLLSENQLFSNVHY